MSDAKSNASESFRIFQELSWFSFRPTNVKTRRHLSIKQRLVTAIVRMSVCPCRLFRARAGMGENSHQIDHIVFPWCSLRLYTCLASHNNSGKEIQGRIRGAAFFCSRDSSSDGSYDLTSARVPMPCTVTGILVKINSSLLLLFVRYHTKFRI